MAADRGRCSDSTLGDAVRGPAPAANGDRAAWSAGGAPGAERNAPDEGSAASVDRGGATLPRPRRGTRRRATGGTAPDAERALRPTEWDDAARQLGADAPEPGESGGGAGHAQWLREQRPPHWG